MFENILHGIIDKPGPVSESKIIEGKEDTKYPRRLPTTSMGLWVRRRRRWSTSIPWTHSSGRKWSGSWCRLARGWCGRLLASVVLGMDTRVWKPSHYIHWERGNMENSSLLHSFKWRRRVAWWEGKISIYAVIGYTAVAWTNQELGQTAADSNE